ncbi:MAG: murein biosynthesis integral membrane protein MurJ, partial [Spirochaetales bacterium]|nr:murein biosynthesis integral membrane protein MurJ [Spirochaetales bacterium]
NNLRKLLAEGALSSAFVPVLSRARVEDPEGERSRRIVRSLIGLQLVILIPFLAAATIFAQPVVNAILDFPELERQVLAADLFRWLIHYVLLISVAAVLMGTLNSHHHFLVPALAPLWFSIAVIGSTLLWHRSLGVHAMVVGVLVGGLGQLLLQVPRVRAYGYNLLPRLDVRDPDFRAIVKRWLPVVATASGFTINQQIALFFASGLEDGSGSAMTNALVFWQLPFGIFGASITTVLFPAMSRHHAAGDNAALRSTVAGGLRALVLLLIPASVGLGLFAEEIISVALQRGAFTYTATVTAARVLVYYCLGLFSVGAFTFLQRFFYARGDYRTPLIVATITMVLDVSLSLWLKETALGVAGLALANSLAFTVGLLLLLLAVRRATGALRTKRLFTAVVRALCASAAAAAAVLAVRRIWSMVGLAGWSSDGSSLVTLALLLAETLPALAVLIGSYRSMGISIAKLAKGHEIT